MVLSFYDFASVLFTDAPLLSLVTLIIYEILKWGKERASVKPSLFPKYFDIEDASSSSPSLSFQENHWPL
jgi:hypothetical protein